MADFPVDQLNLSFSEGECKNLFITQSTFRDINAQDVEDALEYFKDFSDVSFGELKGQEAIDLTKMSQESNDMCDKIFDFSDDHDNGWSVLNDNVPFIVTRKSDGKVFTVARDEKPSVDNVTIGQEIDSKD